MNKERDDSVFHKGTFKVNKPDEWPQDIRLPNDIQVCLLARPRISNMRNLNGTKHFHSHLENKMLKNQKILKIGQRLGVLICDQSFST